MKYSATLHNNLIFRQRSLKKRNLRKIEQNQESLFLSNLLHRCKKALTAISAALLTGSLFLGCSYLFFINLAEHGW